MSAGCARTIQKKLRSINVEVASQGSLRGFERVVDESVELDVFQIGSRLEDPRYNVRRHSRAAELPRHGMKASIALLSPLALLLILVLLLRNYVGKNFFVN